MTGRQRARASQAARIALVILGCGVSYLALLALFALPAERTLSVGVEVASRGTLRVLPDVGRGFFPADGEDVELLRSGSHSVSIPIVARRVKIELASSDASDAITSIALAGTRLEPRSAPSRARVVNALPEPRLSMIAHGLAAAAAVAFWLAIALHGGFRRALLAPLCRPWRPLEALRLVDALLVVAEFVGAIAVLALAADAFHVLVRGIDNPPYWPVSVFEPARPGLKAVLFAVALIAIVPTAFVRGLRAGRAPLLLCVAVAATSLLAANSFHGWQRGFVEPIAGPQTYLPDALSVGDALEFMRRFTEIQPGLRTHSRTHPPGAVLTHWALLRLTGDPGRIAVVLGLGSFFATLLLVFRWVRARVDEQAALLTTAVLAFVPAVQVYFIASLDGLVCACFTATLSCFTSRDARVRYGGTCALLVLSMFLSFGALFLFLVLLLFDVRERRSVKSFAVVAIASAVVYAGVDAITGFDWTESLRIAARLENPRGFLLFDNPGSYAFTRLEGVAELALFAGPFLLGAAARGALAERMNGLGRLAAISGLSFLALLATGAYKTGETARAALFLFPLLALPLARRFAASDPSAWSRARFLLIALSAQTLLFQLFGDFYW